MALRWLFWLSLAGCYAPDVPAGAPCSPAGDCPSGQRCLANVCTAGPVTDAAASDDACNEPARCESGDVVGCGEVIACEHGCGAAPAPHCLALVPALGLSPALLADATAELILERASFNTDSGEIRMQNVVIREAGQGVIAGIGFTVLDGLGVFTADRFVVADGHVWRGSGAHALVLFAAGSIDVAGTIDVGSQGGNLAGPGGANGGTSENDPPCRGLPGGWVRPGVGGGGGGGGGATAGGAGAGESAPGGAGGTVCERPSTVPLIGGNGGGAAGTEETSTHGGSGGGGGGAIALVAMSSITITGVVGAPGGGGNASADDDGGGGGGSGGAVLVEAPRVTIIGAVTANGGGGAAPTNLDGSRGAIDVAVPASGGSANGGRGGLGGAGTMGPTNGTTYGDGLVISRGGGGGGAVGRIHVRRAEGTLGGLASPAARVEDAVLE